MMGWADGRDHRAEEMHSMDLYERDHKIEQLEDENGRWRGYSKQQQAEIEKLRAAMTKVQNIVFDAVEDVSKNRADAAARFEDAILDLDVLLNGGGDDGGD